MNTYCFVKYVFDLNGVYINIYILEPTNYQNNALEREFLPKQGRQPTGRGGQRGNRRACAYGGRLY